MDVSNRLIAEAFVELADRPAARIGRLADRCVQLLGADAAGALLAGPSNGSTAALDTRPVQVNEGPGIECLTTGLPVRCLDLDTAWPRWPRFTPPALEAGFGSVYAFPMRHSGGTVGALEVFAAHAVGLGDDELALAQGLADIAAVGIVHERVAREATTRVEQLQQALNSRVTIEQAKGIIAERYEIDVDTAFSALRDYARSHGRRLHDVAEAVVTTPTGSATCSQ
ncbi:GAF and ANTAR domain-containing protein [Pseudonocardia zijingensis]|uniref:GAF and ANTAR domain-containing protein n=1 Tax=Pseudonocardia zijingensis TaxID=153376 RepID=UPI0031E20EF2